MDDPIIATTMDFEGALRCFTRQAERGGFALESLDELSTIEVAALHTSLRLLAAGMPQAIAHARTLLECRGYRIGRGRLRAVAIATDPPRT